MHEAMQLGVMTQHGSEIHAMAWVCSCLGMPRGYGEEEAARDKVYSKLIEPIQAHSWGCLPRGGIRNGEGFSVLGLASSAVYCVHGQEVGNKLET